MNWLVVTGEYPPQAGGVGHYTEHVVEGLRRRGETVHVCAPSPVALAGPHLTRLPDHFGNGSRRVLADKMAGADVLLLQYVPHAYGWRGMNLPFAWWLATPRLWVMFHEVAMPFAWRQKPHYNLMAMVQQIMAAVLARRSERVFVSCEAWRRRLPACRTLTVLPVFANVATRAEASDVVAARAKMSSDPTATVVGRFANYLKRDLGFLAPMFRQVLEGKPCRRLVLLGTGSREFAALLGHQWPHLAERISGTGCLAPGAISSALQACDVLLQPFPDGVTTRRTSIMAGLAHGVPVVTNRGPLTESLWWRTGAVKLVDDVARMAIALDELLCDPRRQEQGARGARLYQEAFSLEHTLDGLMGASQP